MTGSLKKQGKYYYLTINIGKEQVGIKENGKPKYKYIQKKINTKCTKITEARKVQAEIVSQINNNTFVEPKKILFSNFMKDWLESYAKNNCEESTYDGYKMIIEKHIVPYFEGMNILLQDLKPVHIQKYYDYKLKEGRADGKGGLSPNTVLKHHANIHKALDYAVKMQLIIRNVSDAVMLPKKKSFKAKFYNDKQIEKLIGRVKNTPIEVPVILTALLGLRRGEVLGLKWKHIDLEEKTILIVDTRVQSTRIIEKSTKNISSTRTLPIPDLLFSFLKNVRLQQIENKLQCGKIHNKEDYVCCWDDGTPLKPDYVSHKFKEMLEKSDLPVIRFHDLRHSNASFLLKQGTSMKEIQSWLGHKQLSTTADIYSHVDFEMKKESAKKLNSLSLSI